MNLLLEVGWYVLAVVNIVFGLAGWGPGPWQAYNAAGIGCLALARTFTTERRLKKAGEGVPVP